MHIILVLFCFYFLSCSANYDDEIATQTRKKEIALEVLLFTFIFLLNFSFSIILKGWFLKLILWLLSTFNKIIPPPSKKKTTLYQRMCWKPWESICAYYIWGWSVYPILSLNGHIIYLCGVNKTSTTKLFYERTSNNKDIHRPVNVNQTGTKNGWTPVQTLRIWSKFHTSFIELPFA